MAQKIIKIGKSTGVTIPKSVLEELGLELGDQVQITASDGSLTISPTREVRERQEKVARVTLDFVDRYREDLDALAQ